MTQRKTVIWRVCIIYLHRHVFWLLERTHSPFSQPCYCGVFCALLQCLLVLLAFSYGSPVASTRAIIECLPQPAPSYRSRNAHLFSEWTAVERTARNRYTPRLTTRQPVRKQEVEELGFPVPPSYTRENLYIEPITAERVQVFNIIAIVVMWSSVYLCACL